MEGSRCRILARSLLDTSIESARVVAVEGRARQMRDCFDEWCAYGRRASLSVRLSADDARAAGIPQEIRMIEAARAPGADPLHVLVAPSADAKRPRDAGPRVPDPSKLLTRHDNSPHSALFFGASLR